MDEKETSFAGALSYETSRACRILNNLKADKKRTEFLSLQTVSGKACEIMCRDVRREQITESATTCEEGRPDGTVCWLDAPRRVSYQNCKPQFA